jgi:5-methyltetrahydrofolate--homocysteine methyltransferase
MFIVGELINSSRKKIKENMEKRDAGYFRDLAKKQVEAGASYVDINSSTMMEKEREVLQWLIENIESVVDAPLSIDTPDQAVMEFGLSLTKNGQPMLNSLTAEPGRYEKLIPLITKYNAKVVALCIDEHGMPESADARVKAAETLVGLLTDAGVPHGDIYIDPVITPVSTSDNAGLDVTNATRIIKQKYPDVNMICGLSNISFGLPNRKILNRVFMIQTLTMGMDGFILDPLDNKLMGDLYGAQALLGQDKYCTNYLTVHRNGLYEQP